MNNVAKNRKEIKKHISSVIKRKGYAILSVCGRVVPGSQPINYAYTVGLRDLNMPELLMVGIPSTNTLSKIIENQIIVWQLSDSSSYDVRDDLTYKPGMRTRTEKIDGDAACKLYCSELRRHYPRKQINMAQILFPDESNLLPGEVGYNVDYDQGPLHSSDVKQPTLQCETLFDKDSNFESIVVKDKVIECKFSQPQIGNGAMQLLFIYDGKVTILNYSSSTVSPHNFAVVDAMADSAIAEYLKTIKGAVEAKPRLVGAVALEWVARSTGEEVLSFTIEDGRRQIPLLEIETAGLMKIVHIIDQSLEGLTIDPTIIESLIDSIPPRTKEGTL